MKINSALKAVIALIFANIFWGGAPVIFKLALTNIPPMTLAFWRFILAVPLLLIIARWDKTKPVRISVRDLPLTFLYAVFGITVNIIFFFLGLKLTNAINAPIIITSQPIFTYLLALVFLHERFRPAKIGGMLLGSFGIMAIVFEPLIMSGGSGSMTGNLLLVVATAGAIIQTIIGRKILPRYNPFSFTAVTFIIGSLSFLPLMLYEYATIPGLYASVNWLGITGIIYGAVFCGVGGYGLFGYGLSRLEASDVSLFSYIDPVVGTILGITILNEQLTPGFLFGAVCIFTGIFLAERRVHYHPVGLFVRQFRSLNKKRPA